MRRRRAHYLSRGGARLCPQKCAIPQLDHSLGPRRCVIECSFGIPVSNMLSRSDRDGFFVPAFHRASMTVGNSLQIHDHTATLVRAARVTNNSDANPWRSVRHALSTATSNWLLAAWQLARPLAPPPCRSMTTRQRWSALLGLPTIQMRIPGGPFVMLYQPQHQTGY